MSRPAGRGGPPQSGQSLRNSTTARRRRAPGSAKAQELLEQAQSLEESSGLLSPAAYDPSARKAMHYRSYERRQRRK